MHVKKFIGFFILLCFILNSTLLTQADGYYEIQELNIRMDVSENNIYTIKESISVNFTSPRHGLYRKIPIKYYNYKHQIDDIYVTDALGNPYEIKVSKSPNYVTIRIGSEEAQVSGETIYNIYYTYNMGDDLNRNMDEIYWNLVGNEWSSFIPKIFFTINMPKSFPEELVNLTSGELGSINTSYVNWWVEGNSIRGYTNRTHEPYETLTIAIPLEEGYFTHVSKASFDYISLFICLLMLAILPFIIKSRREYEMPYSNIQKKIVYYPPENFNPPELDYILNRTIDSKSITSLIFYWANKGFLSIKEIGHSHSNRMDYQLKRLKPIETSNTYEEKLFNELFRTSTNDTIPISSLKKELHKPIRDAQNSIIRKIDEMNIFDQSYIKRYNILFKTRGILLFIAYFYFLFSQNMEYVVTFALAFLLCFITYVIAAFIPVKKMTKKNHLGKLSRKFMIMGCIIIISIAIGELFIPDFLSSLLYSNIFWLIITVILFYVTYMINISSLHKATDKGIVILEEIESFKDFLETANKEDLHQLMNDNLNYFYDILPFSLVLGIKNTWSYKFNDLVKKSPHWYQSIDSLYNPYYFSRRINTSLGSISRTISVTPSSSGGSAGGGAGGGGGGSW